MSGVTVYPFHHSTVFPRGSVLDITWTSSPGWKVISISVKKTKSVGHARLSGSGRVRLTILARKRVKGAGNLWAISVWENGPAVRADFKSLHPHAPGNDGKKHWDAKEDGEEDEEGLLGATGHPLELVKLLWAQVARIDGRRPAS